jgi:hypothetical protein
MTFVLLFAFALPASAQDDARPSAATPAGLCEIVRARAREGDGSARCRVMRTARGHGVRAALLRVVETHATTTDNVAIAIFDGERWVLAGEFYPAYTGQGMFGRLDLRSVRIASASEIVIEARRTQGWIDGFCDDRPCEPEDRAVDRLTCSAAGGEWRCELVERPGLWP